MKLAILMLLIAAVPACAQKPSRLIHVATLKTGARDGANGAGVAWNANKRKYYAAMAGNPEFPMQVFEENGNKYSGSGQQAGFDIRGLWYDEATGTIGANLFNGGFAEFKTDDWGIPAPGRKSTLLLPQPDPQSAGAFDSRRRLIYFFNTRLPGIEPHNLKNGAAEKAIHLYPGARNRQEVHKTAIDVARNYNTTAIVCTALPHGNIGLLNTSLRQVELYDETTGLMTAAYTLPEDAPIENSLNFAYCNNTFWFFDRTGRQWEGYRLK